MKASGTFTVKSFVPTEVAADPAVTTGTPVGVATMEKLFAGEISGYSTTLFTAAFDQTSGIGTYLAMESFEGFLNENSGTFNFAHSATTTGSDRAGEYFIIVPSSGTGGLAGIHGDGGIAIDEDGTHRIWFDYDLAG